MKKREKGFTLVEGLIILVVVILIGGVGYFVFANRDSNKDKNDTNNQTSQQKDSEESADEAEAKYLDIPEVGVRIKLTGAVEGAYYSVSNEGYAYFSTHYFDNVEGFEQCRSNAKGGEYGVAALTYAKVGDDNFGSPWTQAEFDGFSNSKIGDTYYWINGAQATCWDNEKFPDSNPHVQKANEIRKAFTELSSSIEKL